MVLDESVLGMLDIAVVGDISIALFFVAVDDPFRLIQLLYLADKYTNMYFVIL